ncbi:hypothetical protein PRZ48_011569 [Zasmidium cellare]|uniref:Major facilitator superfamily (MFS) profile domain-containing protein n=1 Tax=Zasmidium cellare TaxID=395010 RepID=A0ABR0E6Q8_ZASCE|nr:hypothetical protein PRZ48_011569 [Zasmidium cellare]
MADAETIRVDQKGHNWIKGDIITVDVGSPLYRKQFHLHKELLKKRSRWFTEKIDNLDSTRTIRLGVPDVKIFDLYMQLIYTGKIPSKNFQPNFNGNGGETCLLVDFYCMCTTLQDERAMDAAISAILDIYKEEPNEGGSLLPGTFEITNVYNKTSLGSTLRRLVVDLYVLDPRASVLDRFGKTTTVPRVFFLDLSKAMMKKYKTPGNQADDQNAIAQIDPCDYHQHKKDAPCSSKKRKREDNDEVSVANGSGYALQDPHAEQRARTPAEKRLLWKQDFLILPLLALVFFVTYLDRNSFGNARIIGLQKELGFSNHQFATAGYLFYIGYIVFLFPGSIFMQTIPAYLQIGVVTVAFGCFVAGMSSAKNLATLYALRFLVGVAQAFVQITGLYLSLWYTRREVAVRAGIVFSSATIAGAFSGLIAYAVGDTLSLKNSGREPWQWLFLIEGVIAVGFGLLVAALLPRYPDRLLKGKHWLFGKEEIQLVVERTAGKVLPIPQNIIQAELFVLAWNTPNARTAPRQILAMFRDPKSYAFALMNSATGLTLSTTGVFLPTFIKQLGYSAVNAQLFSVIPYACAFVAVLVVSYISDRLNVKGPFIAAGFAMCAVGYVVLLTEYSAAAGMVATCLITSGTYPCIVLGVAWLGINNAGFTKRAATWALSEVFAQAFAIMGIQLYGKGAPRFLTGHSTVLAFQCLAVVVALAAMAAFKYLNKKRDRALGEYAARGEAHPHVDRTLEDECDWHVNFRYTL